MHSKKNTVFSYNPLLLFLFLVFSLGLLSTTTVSAKSKNIAFEKARAEAIQSVIEDPKNKRVVYDAVWVSSDAFQYADESLKKDKEYVISIMHQDGKLLTLIDKSLQKDVDVLLAVVKELTLATYDTSYRDRYLERDIAFVRYALKNYVSDERDDDKREEKFKQFVIKTVSQYGTSLKFFGDMSDDEDVVIAAISNDANAYRYDEYGYEANRKVMLALLVKDGLYLEDVEESFKNDKELVMAAVTQVGYAFKFANEKLRADRDFVLGAVRANAEAYYHLSDSLKNDREIALIAVSANGNILRALSAKLVKDKEIVAAAVKVYPYVFKYVDQSLKDDVAFVKSLDLE